MINTDLGRSTARPTPTLRRMGSYAAVAGTDPCRYLNNILEQDHRAIKRRVNAKQGFREFRVAQRTIQGCEAMHMIRKGQARYSR
jgi:transposase-like protein